MMQNVTYRTCSHTCAVTVIVGATLLAVFLVAAFEDVSFIVIDFTATIRALCTVVLKNQEKNCLL